MKGNLAGEVVVITGAARGIGSAIAETALRQGASAVLFDLLEQELNAIAASLTDSGGRVFALVLDVTDEKAIAEALRAAAAALGPATVLVNNAGRNAYFDAVEMTTNDWDDVFAVDLKAAWLMARAVLPAMIERRHGSIVNIGSLHATLTCAGMFPYAAAKSGLVGLTRSLALDVARHGVRVNAVSPGYIRTALVDEYFARHLDRDAEERALAVQPLDRLGLPQEVAEVVCFLASSAASYVTGADWAVDGGLGVRFA